jgi:uncharacterized protein YycO
MGRRPVHFFFTIILGLAAALSTAAFAETPPHSPDIPVVQDGDIIFHRSLTSQAAAIAAATHSEFTHMGVIFIEDGKPVVYEAVQPVGKAPLDEWIKRGDKEHYVIKRLKDSSKLDTVALKKEVTTMLGKNYDWLFEWSDDSIYCSELVWKGYERASGIKLGELRTLKELDLSHAAVQKILKERYGDKVPYAMEVICPCDVFSSTLLETVESK